MNRDREIGWSPYHSWDLNESRLLPTGWQKQTIELVEEFGSDTILRGDSSTSREQQSGVEIPVRVVTGDLIFNSSRWLYDLYANQLLSFASKSFGRKLYVATDIRSSININALVGKGQRYERHVDSNPVTGLLFATTHSPDDGGVLVFENESTGERCEVYSNAGTFICFDARTIPHYVSELLIDIARISIPMNFYETPIDQNRPDDLDSALYESG